MFALSRGVTRRHLAIGSVLVAIAAVAVLLLVPHRLSRDEHLPAPQHLSRAARAVLHARMERHGVELAELQRALLRIDLTQAALVAARVAEEPSLARPLAGDATELNTVLPEKLFKLQDELKAAAARLARAAAARETAETADAYGQVARTCVACHEVYLHEPAGAANGR